jgi:2-keto-4-pentenoate hydratase/2-oxohepta-3-ene-1,7-dioic acid hydratase in catechol pathway
MKYCRFEFQGEARFGLVETIRGAECITKVSGNSPEAGVDVFLSGAQDTEPIRLAEAKLLAPVQPSKIVCLGRNYRAHAAEMSNEVPKEPLIFFKPPSSIIGPGQQIQRPRISNLVDFEGELGIVISRSCYKLPTGAPVRPYILGYTALNDVSARDFQKKDGQWTRAKGFDTFCPVGPMVTDEIDPWKGVRIETRVNGEIHQQGTTLDLVFDIDAMIHYIAGIMTLLPGDLIATGTPEGVGPLVSGDVVEISVEGVGTLKNSVVDA